MNPCRRPVCADTCIGPPGPQVGGARQLVRLLGLLAAVVAGMLVLVGATAVPGYRRSRRGAWAVGHAARWVLRGLGVHLVVHGAPRSGPSLVVGNHVSWLDILALAGSAPMVMVAKSEVRRWPVVGGAAARAGTIFLQRSSLRSLPGTLEQVTARLRSGQRVQVFPEATTRCGGALGEFHRAAFQSAIDAGVVVSPVTIGFGQHGLPRTTAAAFLGEESLLDSLRRVLAAGRMAVTVRWLPAIPAIAGTGRNHLDRATVARLAENVVAADLSVPIVRRRARPDEPPGRVGQAPVTRPASRPVARR